MSSARPDQEDPLEVIKQTTGGRGVDLSLECIGHQKTIDLAVRVLKTGGRAVIVGPGIGEHPHPASHRVCPPRNIPA